MICALEGEARARFLCARGAAGMTLRLPLRARLILDHDEQ